MLYAKAFYDWIQHVWKNFGILFLPCDDAIFIDNLTNFKARFTSLLWFIPTHTRLEFQSQTGNFKISSFLYIHTIIGGFIIVQKRRTYIRLSNFKDGMLIIDCIDSNAYFFSQTQFMIVEPRIISERSRCSSMILGFYINSSLTLFL